MLTEAQGQCPTLRDQRHICVLQISHLKFLFLLMLSAIGVHNSPRLADLTLTQTLCEEMHAVTIVCMLRSSARSVA